MIKTDTANINTDLNLTAKTDAKSVDAAAMVIPGISKSLKKTDTEKVPATGQRDDGTKAHGSATLALTDCSKDQVTIPAGTSLISGSLAFLTQAEIVLKSVKIGSQCKNSDFPDFSTATVNVSAQNAGDKYNLSARAYSVSGFTNVSASGSNMTGGTSKLTQVVSQSDVDNAKQKVSDRLSVAATTELRGQFTTDNALPLTDTFAAGTPTVASTPNVNEPGSDVSVSVTITFTELGVKQDDLKQIVEAEIKKHIDVSKQVIQDNGISKATILISDKTSPNQVKFNIKTLAIAGPELDADGIKKEVAGKKKGQTQTIIQSRPGIKDVTISYSPFWVYSTPKNTKHITVTFDQNNAGQ